MNICEKIKKLICNDCMIFELRDFWPQMGIDESITRRRYGEILGNDELHIRDAREALDYLKPILNDIQSRLIDYIQSRNTKEVIFEIYKIFDKCFYIYMAEKTERVKLVKQNIADEDLNDAYLHNRNIEICLIDSCNIWLENCVLLQCNLEKNYNSDIQDIDPILAIDLFLYGSVSRAISYISLSRRLADCNMYYGIDVFPQSYDPIVVCRNHPAVYHNLLISGNQEAFNVTKEEGMSINDSPFGKGFYDEYGVTFIESLRLFSSLQKYELKDGQYACVGTNKEGFYNIVKRYKTGLNPENVWKTFVLTKEKLECSKNASDPIIWKIGVNKERHEIRPFLSLEDGTVFIAHQALEQAKNIWLSFYCNGGIAYSNVKDRFTLSEEIRNRELSDKMVDLLIGKLKNKYTVSYCDSDVDYKRIFGQKEENYGDYDVIFYTKDVNELFLIESKYYSDSLNNSGLINDFDKTFGEKGYYYHCRKRYDLVISEPEKMKEFVGAEGQINVHMLYVTSKPLEFELQDQDGVVTFIPISIFDKYIDGNLISEDGSTVVRPVIKL